MRTGSHGSKSARVSLIRTTDPLGISFESFENDSPQLHQQKVDGHKRRTKSLRLGG